MGLFTKKHVWICNICTQKLGKEEQAVLMQKHLVEMIQTRGLIRAVSGDPITDPNGNLRWVACMDCYQPVKEAIEKDKKKEERKQKQQVESGKLFHSVSIGNQTWMSENLKVNRFRNGDRIAEAKSKDKWIKAGEDRLPAWCYIEAAYKDELKYKEKLYNWYAVIDPRGLAPEGWRVPTNEDWNELEKFVILTKGIEARSDPYTGKYLKSPDFSWYVEPPVMFLSSENADKAKERSRKRQFYDSMKARDDFGFSGLPFGKREENGDFKEFGKQGNWWTQNEKEIDMTLHGIHIHRIDGLGRTIIVNSRAIFDGGVDKATGYSVRCIKDSQ